MPPEKQSKRTSDYAGINGAGGDPPRRTLRPFTEDELAFMRHYAEQGYSAASIAEALGRQPSSVANRLVNDGVEYVRARGGTSPGLVPLRAPRIFDGPRTRLPAEKVQEVISSARRNTTIADVARETGLDRKTVERVLQQHAPTVWRWQMHGGIIPPGGVISRTAGDIAYRSERLVENGLRKPLDYDNLVVDYGRDEVERWLRQLDADHHALRNLRRELRHALGRAARS